MEVLGIFEAGCCIFRLNLPRLQIFDAVSIEFTNPEHWN